MYCSLLLRRKVAPQTLSRDFWGAPLAPNDGETTIAAAKTRHWALNASEMCLHLAISCKRIFIYLEPGNVVTLVTEDKLQLKWNEICLLGMYANMYCIMCHRFTKMHWVEQMQIARWTLVATVAIFHWRRRNQLTSTVKRESWKSASVVNAHLVDDPTIRQPGFALPRQQWSLLNRFRTGQGHCGACKKKWKLSDSDQFPCGETQTMSHIVESCPQTRLHGGLSKLHSADDDAVAWLTSYGS